MSEKLMLTTEVQLAGRTLTLDPLSREQVGPFFTLCFSIGADGGKAREQGYHSDLMEILKILFACAKQNHPDLIFADLESCTDVEITLAVMALGALTANLLANHGGN